LYFVSQASTVWQVLLMVRRMRDYAGASASERFVARRVADELKLADRVATDAIRDVTTGREYSFFVNAYKPRYYYWEVSRDSQHNTA
jgi:hypothetical protein